MPNFDGLPIVTTLRTCTAGDLIMLTDMRGSDAHRQLTIILRVSEIEVVAAALEDVYEEKPRLRTLALHTRCLSFGSDYVIELDHSASTPINWTPDKTEAGCILIDENGPMICLATSATDQIGRYNRNYFDFATGSPQNPEYSSIYPSWKIWRSEADRIRPNGKPLFQQG